MLIYFIATFWIYVQVLYVFILPLYFLFNSYRTGVDKLYKLLTVFVNKFY